MPGPAVWFLRIALVLGYALSLRRYDFGQMPSTLSRVVCIKVLIPGLLPKGYTQFTLIAVVSEIWLPRYILPQTGYFKKLSTSFMGKAVAYFNWNLFESWRQHISR